MARRLSFRVCKSGKFTRYGIVVRLVCNSAGYVRNFSTYDSKSGFAPNTITTVLATLESRCCRVYVSYFNNSVRPNQALLEKKFNMIGIVKTNPRLAIAAVETSETLSK
jgi:hypothetical protein